MYCSYQCGLCNNVVVNAAESVYTFQPEKILTWKSCKLCIPKYIGIIIIWSTLCNSGLEPARLGGLLQDPETRTILKNWKQFSKNWKAILKHWKSKKSLSTSPFFWGRMCVWKKMVIGKSSLKNWKTKWTLAKIAGSSPVCNRMMG